MGRHPGEPGPAPGHLHSPAQPGPARFRATHGSTCQTAVPSAPPRCEGSGVAGCYHGGGAGGARLKCHKKEPRTAPGPPGRAAAGVGRPMEPGGAALGRRLQRWAAGEGGAVADLGAYPSASAGPGAEAAGGALKEPTREATSRAAAGTPACCRGRRAARTPCGVVGLWGGGVWVQGGGIPVSIPHVRGCL